MQFAPVRSYAVTTDEIEALKKERDAISAQRAEKQAVVDKLEEEQAGILERKNALDQRNELTRQQIELNEQQIKLYDAMIEEEAVKLEEATALEEEQLERYRSRVRAMEENGSSVSQGDTIGYLGNTGNSYGTHCHFEVIQNGTQIDPLPYFSGYELEPGAAD